MNEKKPPWKLLLDNEHAYLEAEPIAYCFIGSVFQLTEGRSAWNDTWSESSSTCPTLETAKGAAEGRRKQGSSFAIVQHPAIVAVGPVHAIALFDRHVDNPFREWTAPTDTGLTLLWFVRALPGNGWFAKLLCERGYAHNASLPICSWRSESGGGDASLGWKPKQRPVDLAPVCDVHRWLTLHLQANPAIAS